MLNLSQHSKLKLQKIYQVEHICKRILKWLYKTSVTEQTDRQTDVAHTIPHHTWRSTIMHVRILLSEYIDQQWELIPRKCNNHML